MGGGSQRLTWVLPHHSVCLSLPLLQPALLILQLLPSIPWSLIFTSCLFLTTGVFPPVLYKTHPQKEYYNIIFSVHWSAISVQDEIIHFDE